MNTDQTATIDGTILSAPLRACGRELMDHQCWAFGKDIINHQGNLLVEHGFVQVRCPDGGLTQYELRHALGEDSHVFLWGFGAFFGREDEGIFLPRSLFSPMKTQGRVELHRKDYFPFVDESTDMTLLCKGMAWFAQYEDWIASRTRDDYRSETFKEFPRLTLPPRDLARRWNAFATRMALFSRINQT